MWISDLLLCVIVLKSLNANIRKNENKNIKLLCNEYFEISNKFSVHVRGKKFDQRHNDSYFLYFPIF